MSIVSSGSLAGIRTRAVLEQGHVNAYRKRKPLKKTQVISAVLLFVTLSFQLWLRTQIIERGYELESVRKAALSNDSILRELKLQYAVHSRPTEIEHRAEKELQLQVLLPQNVRRIVLTNANGVINTAAADRRPNSQGTNSPRAEQ